MRGIQPLLLVAGLVCGAAHALDFRSVAEPAVVLYDAPSKQGTKLFILSRDYPVEVVIATEGWVRVRDETGAFGWVEAKSLSERRTVMVKTETLEVRGAPSETAPVVFKAERGVTLEFVRYAGGWAEVRHREGSTGFVKPAELWGL
jgi:SH3-like domain-containing protein